MSEGTFDPPPLRVILFGGTGMVGGGVLRECLSDPRVARVVSIGRRRVGIVHPKLVELELPDVSDLSSCTGELSGFDACFFCLRVSSVGMQEPEYRRITYDLTITVARTLSSLNSGMTFTYVSGAGTDTSEQGRSMWARVKGRTENDLLRLPFKAAFMFRPGFIRLRRGDHIPSRGYRVLYWIVLPPLRLAAAIFPSAMTSTDRIGRAMIHVVRDGAPSAWLNNREINALAA